MKRLLPLVLAGAMMLTTGRNRSGRQRERRAGKGRDDDQRRALRQGAGRNGRGRALNFYSTTSFAEKAAANFMQAYPALDGKVIYAEIDDGESYTILTNTIGSGVKDSADMALTQNGAD